MLGRLVLLSVFLHETVVLLIVVLLATVVLRSFMTRTSTCAHYEGHRQRDDDQHDRMYGGSRILMRRFV